MKIAIPYDNGNVFGHFGKTEQFKVYETEGKKILSSEIISSNGTGHGALAGMLADHGVNVLICGGIGGGAREALANAGIEVCAGAEGDCDLAAGAYLEGSLIGSDAVCDHHHEEGQGCGHHEEESACGGCAESEEGCGGCGGCPGHREVSGKNTGHKCTVHYRGTFDDGTQFDSSYDRGQLLEFVCGAGMMIFGFDQVVAGMEKGQIVNVHLMPEDAYGYRNPYMVITAGFNELPGSRDLQVGERVMLSDEVGRRLPAKVTNRTDTSITLDANHELADRELNFTIELVDVD
jgi:FKBP-type peptidyl-prolyl cis-trans isomerase 2/predicted Fe-Mo cluster-binding NifX family protein